MIVLKRRIRYELVDGNDEHMGKNKVMDLD
jgi:hypothetical protein